MRRGTRERRHLCATCEHQQSTPPLCAVHAPASAQALRGERVADCHLYRGHDGRRALRES